MFLWLFFIFNFVKGDWGRVGRHLRTYDFDIIWIMDTVHYTLDGFSRINKSLFCGFCWFFCIILRFRFVDGYWPYSFGYFFFLRHKSMEWPKHIFDIRPYHKYIYIMVTKTKQEFILYDVYFWIYIDIRFI